jgi:hypothetical protein
MSLVSVLSQACTCGGLSHVGALGAHAQNGTKGNLRSHTHGVFWSALSWRPARLTLRTAAQARICCKAPGFRSACGAAALPLARYGQAAQKRRLDARAAASGVDAVSCLGAAARNALLQSDNFNGVTLHGRVAWWRREVTDNKIGRRGHALLGTEAWFCTSEFPLLRRSTLCQRLFAVSAR